MDIRTIKINNDKELREANDYYSAIGATVVFDCSLDTFKKFMMEDYMDSMPDELDPRD